MITKDCFRLFRSGQVSNPIGKTESEMMKGESPGKGEIFDGVRKELGPN